MRTRVALAIAIAVLVASCGPAATPMPDAEGGVRTLAVSVNGSGRVLSLPPAIDCPGVCTATFAQGSSVTLAASPVGEGEFMEWSGDCMGAMGCFVSMDGEAQVIATFGMGMMPMLRR
jgi:hypothetical protein